MQETQNNMGKVKMQSAELSRGILSSSSGIIIPIITQKNGVIRARILNVKRKSKNKQ